jgi:hypothetical protein
MIIAPSGTGGTIAGAAPSAGRFVFRRVPDQHRRVRAEPLSGPFAVRVGADPRTGIAHALVDLPAAGLIAVAHGAEIFAELGLVLVERQRARTAHGVFQLLAQLQVPRDLFGGLLVGAGGGGLRRDAREETDDNGERRNGTRARLRGTHHPLRPPRAGYGAAAANQRIGAGVVENQSQMDAIERAAKAHASRDKSPR